MFSRGFVWGLVCFLTLALVAPALAQRGGGGRGGGGGPGGPGGGDFRARILERIDANGNGVIEPEEAQGRAQGFIQRMAEEAGIDPRGPIRIDRLVGGSGSSGRGGRGDSRGGDRGSSQPRSSSRSASGSSATANPYPAVNPFGDESVPGFGINPLMLNGKIIDLEKKYDRRVLDFVERTMEQYDKNKNGILERNEWASVSWRGDPRESDLDSDGMLTKAEMAERLATRFREGGRGGNPGDRGGDRRGGGGPPQAFGRGGPPGESRRGGDPQRGGDPRAEGDRGRGGRFGGRGGPPDPTEMIRRMDQNGDGVIQPDEIDERRRRFMSEGMGIDFSQPVPVEEIAKRIQERMTRGQEEARSRDQAQQAEQKKKEEAARDAYRITGTERLKNRKSYRAEAVALPDKLPDWWSGKDTNLDGQITLAEYLGNQPDRSSDPFSDLDTNRDGVVTAQEAHAAAPADDGK